MDLSIHSRGVPGLVTCAMIVVLMVPSGIPVVQSQDDEPWWWPTQGEWAETHVLTSGEPEENLPHRLGFGGNVAIDGDTIVASSQTPNAWDNYFSCPGDDGCDWVYVFNRDSDGNWVKTAKLGPHDPQEQDSFGFALDVDEESGVIVVGNPGDRVKADSIYIFERQQDGSWEQTGNFKKEYPDVPPSGWTLFGYSVAVSGHTVAATDVVSGSGNSFLFEKIDGEWVETATFIGGGGPRGVISLAGGGDIFLGRSWEPGEPDECSYSGHMWNTNVNVYHRTDGEWALASTFQPEPEHGTQTSAGRMSMSEDGKTIIIGSSSDARVYGVPTEFCVEGVNTSGGPFGSAWIYEYEDEEWSLTADLPNPTPGAGTSFGRFVDLSGDIAVVGSHDDLNGGPGSGTAYVYGKSDGEWLLEAKLRNHDSNEVDFFGWTVGVSGDTVVAGADANQHHGTVHVFEPVGPTTNIPLPTG